MINRKRIQTYENNNLSKELWNHQPKNGENTNLTNGNSFSSRNNQNECRSTGKIKIREKNEEIYEYMKNLETNKDLNEIKNEPMEVIESESDKEVETQKEKNGAKEQSHTVNKKLNETLDNREEKKFKNKTKSKKGKRKTINFMKKNKKKRKIFKIVKSKPNEEKEELVCDYSTIFNDEFDDNKDPFGIKKLIPIQNYERFEEHNFSMKTQSNNDEIFNPSEFHLCECNVLRYNENMFDDLFNSDHESNLEFINQVDNLCDLETNPYSNSNSNI
jgi:hypothetical protein